MGWRTKLLGGDEFDALTRMRRFLGFKPGTVKVIKRRHNKRARKIARLEAENLALKNLLIEYNEQISRMERERATGP